MDKILEMVENYALTGCVSVNNEDGLTGQYLLMNSARKVRECLTTLLSISTAINSVTVDMLVDYNKTDEELGIINVLLLKVSSSNSLRKFYFLFNENSKSQIELAGDITSAINQSLDYMPEILFKIKELDPEKENTVKELTQVINNSYVNVYDDCAMNLLELASNTAKAVNSLVRLVNDVYELINTINGLTLTTADFTGEDETLSTNISVNNEYLDL